MFRIFSEAFKHEGIGDLRTHDDPLWAYEEDWPDLLGEVDEEAVRRAANQPIAIESNLTLIVPQLSSNNERHDSDRSSRGEDRAPNDAKTRNESKRNEDRSGGRASQNISSLFLSQFFKLRFSTISSMRSTCIARLMGWDVYQSAFDVEDR